jgi:hypothetical protein
VYLSQFPKTLTPEQRAEKEQFFKANWLSAKYILDTLEVYLSKDLHKLIKDDEDIHNMENPNPEISHWRNIGQRAKVRQIRDDLFGKTEIGDE